MPNNKSAKKRVRVTTAKRLGNKMLKSELKTTLRAFETKCAESKDTGAAILSDTVSKIDKACQKGLIHKNTAARRKARLQRMIAG